MSVPAAATGTGALAALALATAAFMVCFSAWGLIAALAPVFHDLYDLSSFGVSLLIATPVILGSLARIPAGIAADRFGRIVFILLLVGLCAPLALGGLTNSYGSLLAVSLLLGVAGASFAVGVPYVSRWFPRERQGFALGIYGVGNIGTAIANFLAPRLEREIGWRATFWVFIPVLLAMALLFLLFGRDAPVASRRDEERGAQFSLFRRRPVVWLLALYYFITFGGFVAVGAYLPTLLVDEFELSRTEAGVRAAAFIALATVARPLGGYLADRWSSEVILDAVFLMIASLAVLLAFEPPMAVLMLAVLGIAMMFGIGNGAVFKLVATLFPQETGTVTGIVGAAGGLGGFFPLIVIGTVKEVTDSLSIGFMLLSQLAGVCLILNLLVLQRLAGRLSADEGKE
jgi:NNP family nitrate/nitrite transporter-like MFS transporter